VSAEFITTIAVNLGILLASSWILGIIIFLRLIKDKHALESALLKTRKKLKELQAARKQATPANPNFPLVPVILDGEDEDSVYLLNAIDALNSDLLEKDQQLTLLAKLQLEQQSLLEDWQGDNAAQSIDDLLNNHNETQLIVNKLQNDLKISQRNIKQLESKLREGLDKDGRIAILEETERRLRERLTIFKKNKDQAAILADGLRKANEKNQKLRADNDKLKLNIKTLAAASQEQLATISKITAELEKVSRLERHQRKVIEDLEVKIKQEKILDINPEEVLALEKQLQHVNETLERTLREKEFVESHLLEMDKSLQNSKETEAALERARKEIETLEMYFPELEASSEAKAQEKNKTPTEVHKALPQLTINPDEQPELYSIVNDNRLYGILQEFWVTLDTPPLQLMAEQNIQRPKNLLYWVKTSIHNDEYYVVIGAGKKLTQTLATAMFSKADHALSDGDLKDALGELGNVLAGTLANELNADYIVGISTHVNDNDMEAQLQEVAIATEVLMIANEQPLYIALVKPQKEIA
jgi:myosin heavy subunit